MIARNGLHLALARKISVLLVNDHFAVRKGLAQVIDETTDLEVVGEASHGEEALYLSKKLKPDVILMDIKMQAMCGVTVTSLIVQHHDNVRVIGMTMFTEDPDAEDRMIAAGASGYLLEDVTAEDLTDAIRRVHRGETLASSHQSAPEVNDGKAEATAGNAIDTPTTLGEQQKKVLALLTKGFTNPEIALQLGISVSAVRYHVSTILRKLEVSNRSEAVGMAVRLNLVNAEDF